MEIVRFTGHTGVPFSPAVPTSQTQCLHLLRTPSLITPLLNTCHLMTVMSTLVQEKLNLSEPGILPSGAPMSADANLSSDDMQVECLLERFERERVANKSNELVLNRIAGLVSDEQFLEVAGLDGPARRHVANDLLKLGQSRNDKHIAETFSQSKTVVTPSRMGLTPGLLFDMSRSCWDLYVQANAERLCEYLRTERPVLSVVSPKCRAIMDLQSMNRRDPKFSKTFVSKNAKLREKQKMLNEKPKLDNA